MGEVENGGPTPLADAGVSPWFKDWIKLYIWQAEHFWLFFRALPPLNRHLEALTEDQLIKLSSVPIALLEILFVLWWQSDLGHSKTV